MDFKIRSKQDIDCVRSYLDRLSTDKQYEVKITPLRKKRSVSQNALYHTWLSCVAKETGEDVESLHKYFASKFLGYKSVEVMGETINVIISTTKLSTEEFTSYLDQINMFCEIELNIILPYPTDKFYEQFEEQYGK